MAQIINITSEALQAVVRRLLPSQQGFGEDLQASNVITPIIDLTPTAEGDVLSPDLSQSLAFGSQTAFSANNSTDVVANSPGFYRIIGTANTYRDGGAVISCRFSMSDGISTKDVWKLSMVNNTNAVTAFESFDFIVFLSSGDSISAITNNAGAFLQGSSRQIADVNGVTVNPSGFVSQ